MEFIGKNRYADLTKKCNTIIIYGAGAFGDRTLTALKELGADYKIVCYAKSEKEFETYIHNGIKVKSIYDLKEYYKDALFLLAVGEKNMPEIKRVVKKLGISHYMDARKLFLDSFKVSDAALECRKIRNDIYKLKESGSLFHHSGRKAVHITYCLAQNAGDTVLSQCVRRFLAFERWNIKAVDQKVDNVLLAEINAADVLVIGGGGLFLPDTNPNSVSGWQWAVSEEQMKSIRVPIVIFSVGYNYFREQESTELFRNSLNCMVREAVFVGLRNRGSVRAVRNMLSEDLKDKVVYQPCTTTLIRKIYKVEAKKNTKTAAINIAYDREERRFGPYKDKILAQIVVAVCVIQKKGYQILYVAHCDDDLKFLPELDRAHIRYRVKNLTQSLPGEVIECYKNVDVTIGMRGHAQMIPFGIGGKIISLGTHDKMRWFLEDVNLMDCYVDLNQDMDCISDRIVQIFEEICIINPDKMEMRLAGEQEKLWRISCENRRAIMYKIGEKI